MAAVMGDAERQQVGAYLREHAGDTLVAADGPEHRGAPIFAGVPAFALVSEYQGKPLVTTERLAALVREGKVRYVVATQAVGLLEPGPWGWLTRNAVDVTRASGMRADAR